MPIPAFKFDDRSKGTPRQPVPVRFACLAAGWQPAMMAQFVVGLTEEIGPIVTVYALDAGRKLVGEVLPGDYTQYLKLPQEPLPDALTAIPPNHFVWSDELIQSFSDYIDLCLDRETARATGMHIRWTPDLKNCGAAIEECIDFTSLIEPPSSENRMRLDDDTWTITFGGVTKEIKNRKGLQYIHHLLTHPQKVISVRDFEQTISPPPVVSDGGKIKTIAQTEYDAGDEFKEDLTTAEDTADDSGLETPEVAAFADAALEETAETDADLEASDAASINNYKEKIAKNLTLIETANKNGNHRQATVLEIENAGLKKHISSVTNRMGKARKVNSPHERRRKRISLAIARAIEQIAKKHPSFAQHLKLHLRVGSNFHYTPASAVAWTA